MPSLQSLFSLFSLIDDPKEAELLLRDILTPQELETIAERWELIQALDRGLTQREVAKKCGVSISKVTRGAHELKYGKGGFRYFLEKKRSRDQLNEELWELHDPETKKLVIQSRKGKGKSVPFPSTKSRYRQMKSRTYHA